MVEKKQCPSCQGVLTPEKNTHLESDCIVLLAKRLNASEISIRRMGQELRRLIQQSRRG